MGFKTFSFCLEAWAPTRQEWTLFVSRSVHWFHAARGLKQHYGHQPSTEGLRVCHELSKQITKQGWFRLVDLDCGCLASVLLSFLIFEVSEKTFEHHNSPVLTKHPCPPNSGTYSLGTQNLFPACTEQSHVLFNGSGGSGASDFWDTYIGMDLLDSIAWGWHRPYPKLSEYEVIVTSQFKVWTTSPIVQPQYKKGLHEARDSDISHAIEKTSSAWYDLKGKGNSSNVSFLSSLLSTVATNRKGIAVSFLCNIAACQFKQTLELDWNNPAWLCKVMNILQCLCCTILYIAILYWHITLCIQHGYVKLKNITEDYTWFFQYIIQV